MSDRGETVLGLIDSLKKSIEVEDAADINGPATPDNVVQFGPARIRKAVEQGELDCTAVSPQQVMEVVLEDLVGMKCTKCYVTLIEEGEDNWKTINYRSGLSRAEEVGFRQLGVAESIDGWRK